MKDKDVTPFKTSDFTLASFLFSRGMKILGTVPEDGDDTRRQFVFVDHPKRQEWQEEFITGKDDVSAKWFYKSTKMVRRYLYEEDDRP